MSSNLPPSMAGPSGQSGENQTQRDSVTTALALVLVGVIVLLLVVAINDDDGESVEISTGGSTDTTDDTSGSAASDSGDSDSSDSGLPAGEYQFTLTAPAGTVEYSGSCNVVEGVLTASGAGAQEETIVLSVDVVSQTGAASVAALGTEFEGTINSATVGDGTFEVAGAGSEADDSATGGVDFTVAGTCNTAAAGGIPTATASATPSVEPGTYDFVASIPEGTANLEGTCVVTSGSLAVNGSGQAGETLTVTADTTTQSGTMSVAAAGATYDGTVTQVVIGDGSFEVVATVGGDVSISASGGCDT